MAEAEVVPNCEERIFSLKYLDRVNENILLPMEEASSSWISVLDDDDDVRDWLRSPNGLVNLTSHWRTAIYHFHRQGFFNDSRLTQCAMNAYKGLKEDAYTIGMGVYLKEQYTHEEKLIEFGGFTHSDTGERIISGIEEKVDFYNCHAEWKIVFYVSFSFAQSVEDHYKSLSEDQQIALAQNIWNLVSRESVISNSKTLTKFSSEDFYEDRRIWAWDDNESRYNGIRRNSIRFEIVVVRDNNKHRDICGLTFNELRKMLAKYRQDHFAFGSTKDNPSGVFRGLKKSHWEERLASYLLGEGFIVSMEPQIIFPNPEIPGHRVPDLLLFQKGRCIAIEIDDRSHLVHQNQFNPENNQRYVPNLNKWRRDRDLDRNFLCNGIPVLRVWFDDVSERPELIVTQVLQIYESLGGARILYT